MNKFQNFFLKFVLLLGVFVIILSSGIFIYRSSFPQKSLADYYKIMNEQEHISENEVLSPEFMEKITWCKFSSKPKCFVDFFQDYTLHNSLESSFSKLNLLLKEYPEYRPYCHQIAHGIGHGELEKNNGDIGKSLSIFNTSSFFRNLATCGNGYHHGLIEEVVKEEKDKDRLVVFFKDVCNVDFKGVGNSPECIHGLGHAAFIQLDYDMEAAKYVCRKVTNNKFDFFNCLTGIYMEKQISLPSDIKIVNIDGHLVMDKCEQETGSIEKTACYFENIFEFQDKKNIFEDRKNNKNQIFQKMMDGCVQVKDDISRMACVKNVAIRSIIDEQHDDISICFTKGLSENERTMCVTNFAHRIALSIDYKKGEIYKKISSDICRNLNFFSRNECVELISQNSKYIYFTE
jgi:hypothetical protein